MDIKMLSKNPSLSIDPSVKESNITTMKTVSPINSCSIPRSQNTEYKVPSLQELVYECYIKKMEDDGTSTVDAQPFSTTALAHPPPVSPSISFKSNIFNNSNNINTKYQEYFSYKNFANFVNEKHCAENLEFLVSIQRYEKLWNDLFHLNSNCLSCRKRLSTITPEGPNRVYSSNGRKRSLKSSFSNEILMTLSNSTLHELNNPQSESVTPRSSLSYLNSLNLDLNSKVANVESFIDLQTTRSSNNSQQQQHWFNEPENSLSASFPGGNKHKLEEHDQDDHDHDANDDDDDDDENDDDLGNYNYESHSHEHDINHCSCGDSHRLNQNLIDLNDLYVHIVREYITEDSPNQISLPYRTQDELIKEAELKTNAHLMNCSVNPSESHDPRILLSAKDYVMSLLSQNVYKNFVLDCESKIEEDKKSNLLNMASIRGPCGVLNPEIVRPVRGPCGITNPLLAQPLNQEQRVRASSPSPIVTKVKQQSAPNLRHHHTSNIQAANNNSIIHDKKCAMHATSNRASHHRHSNPESGSGNNSGGHSHLLGLKSLKSRIIKIQSSHGNHHECTCNCGNGITNNNSTNSPSSSSAATTGLFKLRRNHSRSRKFSSSSSNSTTTSNTLSSRDSSPSLSPVMNDATMKLSQLSLNSTSHNSNAQVHDYRKAA